MVSSSIAGWCLLSCCLALDSSSSFPCPAFRAIAKSMSMFTVEYINNCSSFSTPFCGSDIGSNILLTLLGGSLKSD
ncbi:hypothetical protein STEG23_016672, partial [Scotinomys teguina]